jgi:hypothetical protein
MVLAPEVAADKNYQAEDALMAGVAARKSRDLGVICTVTARDASPPIRVFFNDRSFVSL